MPGFQIRPIEDHNHFGVRRFHDSSRVRPSTIKKTAQQLFDLGYRRAHIEPYSAATEYRGIWRSYWINHWYKYTIQLRKVPNSSSDAPGSYRLEPEKCMDADLWATGDPVTTNLMNQIYTVGKDTVASLPRYAVPKTKSRDEKQIIDFEYPLLIIDFSLHTSKNGSDQRVSVTDINTLGGDLHLPYQEEVEYPGSDNIPEALADAMHWWADWAAKHSSGGSLVAHTYNYKVPERTEWLKLRIDDQSYDELE